MNIKCSTCQKKNIGVTLAITGVIIFGILAVSTNPFQWHFYSLLITILYIIGLIIIGFAAYGSYYCIREYCRLETNDWLVGLGLCIGVLVLTSYVVIVNTEPLYHDNNIRHINYFESNEKALEYLEQAPCSYLKSKIEIYDDRSGVRIVTSGASVSYFWSDEAKITECLK
jgi:hypothetical protein